MQQQTGSSATWRAHSPPAQPRLCAPSLSIWPNPHMLLLAACFSLRAKWCAVCCEVLRLLRISLLLMHAMVCCPLQLLAFSTSAEVCYGAIPFCPGSERVAAGLYQ